MARIAIIGGGFSGTMLTVHLANLNPQHKIFLVEKSTHLNKGIAYSPYSKKHLLNVVTTRMSAYPQLPDDFLDFVMKHPEYSSLDRSMVGGSFMPRYVYGEYLTEIWNKEIVQKKKQVEVIKDEVNKLIVDGDTIKITLSGGENFETDYCIIASGNSLPGNPSITNPSFYTSENYFQNPWKENSVKNLNSGLPVLILGNGLTMVDTIVSLNEENFGNTIYSLSPNGFNILSHRHSGMKYSGLINELPHEITLLGLVKLFNKHVKQVRSLGISAEPVIDSLRSLTPKIWQSLSDQEKKLFMSRLRHLWGLARHRIPIHIHDRLNQMRLKGKLVTLAGRIKNFEETKNGIYAEFHNRKTGQLETMKVGRVINCTGPESDISKLNQHFLHSLLKKGAIAQDELKLGINADPNTYSILDANGKPNERLYTMGSNLRGLFWESTAVGELRQQAEHLAQVIHKKTT